MIVIVCYFLFAYCLYFLVYCTVWYCTVWYSITFFILFLLFVPNIAIRQSQSWWLVKIMKSDTHEGYYNSKQSHWCMDSFGFIFFFQERLSARCALECVAPHFILVKHWGLIIQSVTPLDPHQVLNLCSGRCRFPTEIYITWWTVAVVLKHMGIACFDFPFVTCIYLSTTYLLHLGTN